MSHIRRNCNIQTSIRVKVRENKTRREKRGRDTSEKQEWRHSILVKMQKSRKNVFGGGGERNMYSKFYTLISKTKYA
jgi:hypothetical protein